MIFVTKSKTPNKPLIGISMRLDPARKKFYLQTNYSEAIAQAGAASLLAPLIPDRKSMRRLVDSLDGIVLSGSGSDIDPQRYGARKIPQCGAIHPERDETDFLLLEEAFKRKMPLLAICFGVQSLNVFLGGTLIQDIPTQCPEALDHELSAPSTASNPENFCAHPVAIAHDSLLFKLAGRKGSVKVNSSHHQAIERVARDLHVTATAPDGIVEGVELKSENHFVFGTQWHPEKGFERDALSQAIFRRFVNEAKRKLW